MDDILIENQGFQFLCENIADLEGFEFATIRSVYVDPPNRSGALYINAIPGKRMLSWRGLIKTNIGANRRLLAAICHPGNLKLLKFTTADGLALQTYAEINKLLNPYREQRSPYLVEFIAPDYRFYSQQQHVATSGLTVSHQGVPIPLAIPAPIPGTSVESTVVTNNGNAVSQPVWEIKGPGHNFLIQNLDTGEQFNLDLTLGDNEVVVIDPANDLTPVLKGEENVFGSVVRNPAGTWVGLNPGTNRIIFAAASGGTINTLLTIKWRDAYGGI